MTEPLKPCPFCGGEVRVLSNIGKPCSADHAWVDCRGCFTNGPEKATEADAITAWNTRAPTVATGEEVERVAMVIYYADPLFNLLKNYESLPYHSKEAYRSQARAAIAALADGRREAPAPEGVGEDHVAREITMQDVRLAVGEGKLTATDVLAGCNAELRRRAALSSHILR